MKLATLSKVLMLAAAVAVAMPQSQARKARTQKKNPKTEQAAPVRQWSAVTDTMPDRYQAGSQLLAYPVPKYYTPRLTPAPAGYEPFHMEHYGRHGSRWLLKYADYNDPAEGLRAADKRGMLTPAGKELLRRLEFIAGQSEHRGGELTPLGHRQHREIAGRMAEHFPTLFTDSTHLDAKSTKVIRCILSMAEEVAELDKRFPGMTVTMDASDATQRILAPNSLDTVARALSKAAAPYRDSLIAKVDNDHSAFMKKVFTDPKFAVDSLKAEDIYTAVLDIAYNAQSHDGLYDLYDYFTDKELTDGWQNYNAYWYLYGGNTPLTKNRTPYMQLPLFREVFAAADTAIVAKNPSVNLRFGHESIVLPFAVLLELGNASREIDNLDDLAARWRNYTIFPMASNIQIVFYRPVGGAAANADDVLMKVLLNEKETTLPVTPVQGPYYRWKDYREYMAKKIGAFEADLPK